MLAGHFSPAFVAKALHSDINLGVAALCCFSNDLLHLLLTLFGVEKFHSTRAGSHSLVSSLLLAGAIFWGSYVAFADATLSTLYALCSASHFCFDLISKTHLFLGVKGRVLPGCGLYRHFFSGLMLLEAGLVISTWSFWVFLRGVELVFALPVLILLAAINFFYYRIIT